MKLIYFLCVSIIFILVSCSTTVNIQNEPVKGKTILVTPFNLSVSKKKNQNNTDTVCACIYESIVYTLRPYFQNEGMKTIILPYDKMRKNAFDWKLIADSLQADYIMVGAGIVDQVGSSTFMDQLSFNVVNKTTGDVFISANFAGSAVGAVKSADKIGRKMAKKFN